MRVLVSGSHGLIGSHLVARMRSRGDSVVRLVRSSRSSDDDAIRWDPRSGAIDRARLEGFDAVIHLAGENLAGLWTRDKRDRIRDSRVRGTGLLSDALSACDHPPRVLASASGIGYYGGRGDALLREEEPPGSDFLARVCRDWEEATRSAADRGIRVVLVRTALVLAREGGVLARLRIPFGLGLGATIGDGAQYMSWITLDDLIMAYLFAIGDRELEGPVNAASPRPVTNRVFTRGLARALDRPAFLKIPAWILEATLGEMAEALFLTSQRAIPARLEMAGFRFSDPDLDGALAKLLG